MHLMNVKWVYLVCLISDAPMLEGADVDGHHRRGIHLEFLPIDVEAIFVFGEDGRELRLAFLHRARSRFGNSFIHGRVSIRHHCAWNMPAFWWHDIGQNHGWILIALR